MKILYNQTETDILLNTFGISNCYFKHLTISEDSGNITPKKHHHTGFEIHIIFDGFQEYEINGTLFYVEAGNLFLIPPLLEHRILSTAQHTAKYSLTFEYSWEALSPLSLPSLEQGVIKSISNRMSELIEHISLEYTEKKQTSGLLISNSVFELLILIFRELGLKEDTVPTRESSENSRLCLAKQYISDNIEAALTVSDVANYCHISTKQLTRIFQKEESTTPLAYIQNQRIIRMEKLLCQKELSLKTISEQMNFTNEYYFNTFFTKHAGMTPGAYRKMLGQ